MSHDGIIELDTTWNELDDPRPPRRLRVNRWRGFAAAALALVCLASLSSSRRAPLPLFQLLGTFAQPADKASENPGDLFFMGGMFVTQRAGSVVALEFDGRQRWSVHVEDSDQDGFLYTRTWNGLVLIEHYYPAPDPPPDTQVRNTGQTIAVDPRTGEEKWRVQGFLEPAGDVVFLHNGNDPVKVYGSLPSGLLWTVPPARASAVDADTHSLVTVSDDNVLTEYDLKTGAVRRSGVVRVPSVNPPTFAYGPQLGGYSPDLGIEVFPEWITLRARLFEDTGTAQWQSASYDRKTLRPLVSPVDNFEATQDCGPVLCAYSGQQVSIVDRHSLNVLWQVSSTGYPYWTGSAFLLVDQSATSDTRVVDPRTGDTLADLNGWTPVDEQREGPPKMHWFIRYARSTTYVGRLDGSTFRLVGPMAFPVVHCLAEEMVLACAASDGRTSVWRVNPS